MPYKLSATLAAHTLDVRAVSSPTNELVLSASRDSSAISWKKDPSGPSFSPETVLRAGSRYVNAVAYIPGSTDAPKGYAVTGGQDTVVNVFSLDHPKDDPTFALLGHTDNVCALSATAGGTIISGSWDSTAKVWKNFKLAYDLKGHQQSVWAVIAVDEEQFLTGSADKTIRLWRQHKLVSTFRGHQDAVRGLSLVPDIGFASCSNDSEIRVWTLGGDLVYTLSGHTSFVYSLSVLPGGEIVSGGEDRSVRVWRDGECAQILTHPAISVWAVSTMPNGDIVSGCSDGFVRVFSASEERWASQEDLKSFDDQVASQALPKEQVGDVKKSDLPGLEALGTPGSKTGDVKMVRNGDNVEAYQWDAAAMTWQQLGTVVDAVGQGRKQLYEGKEYDYVFDVDIQDGVPPLKLPFNVTENPYTAAQKFLEKNELPLSYIDQVVSFIEKNTAGVNLGTTSEEYVDPFTGASRYRSSTGSSAAGSADPSSYVDPYTGASRYTSQGTQPAAPAGNTSYLDPFTGSSSYTTSQPTTPLAPPPSKNVLPSTKPIPFKQAKNVSAMQGKLNELDKGLREEISTSALAMYPEELSSIEQTFAYLAQVTATPPKPATTSLTDSHIETIIQILERWPPSQSFPVIDLSRLVTGHCPNLFQTPSLRTRFFAALFKAAEWDSPWEDPLPKSRQTNILLALKALANVFQDGYTPEPDWLSQVITALDQVPYSALGKTQTASFATVLFNFSCLTARGDFDPVLRQQHIALLIRVIKSEDSEPEASYRALVGLGNALHGYKSSGSGLTPGQSSEIKQIVGSVPATLRNDTRIASIIREVTNLC